MSEIIKKLLESEIDFIDRASKLSVNQLEKAINYASDEYYNYSNSVIEDSFYDILIDFLKLKEPKSKVLKIIGAKPKIKNKVKLDYWAGSMDKIKPPSNQLKIWTKKYKPPYNFSDKLDGVSGLLIYTHDGQINMYTRGSAVEGTNITHLIKYLDLPEWDNIYQYCKKNKIKGDKNLIAFRGELIIKESIFKNNWSKTLKNGRNSVAGLVNSKTINPNLAYDTDFVVYEIIEPFYNITEQFKIISENNFITVNNKTINIPISFKFLSEYLKKRRNKSKYQIDGIIVTSCANNKRNIDGNPKYAFAFKDILEDQKAKTIVESIEWNISKDGFIKPTIILTPVNIGGVEIKRVTGNNAKFIVENKIGIGARLEIIRSGDVIPKIEKVIKISDSGKGELPSMNYNWNESKVDIILNNYKDDPNVLIKNIYYFFSKLETKGLGERNVEKMINAGLNTIPKILAADKETLLNVEGFGEKTADNLVKSIKKSISNVPLDKLISSSNKLGHGIGEEKVKQILNIYPNIILDYKKWSKKEFIDKIKEIDGWEEKTASLLVSNFNNFIIFYNSINKYITINKTYTINQIVKGEFTDKQVVFTGFRDKNLESQINTQGGKIGSTITKKTNFLIVKDKSIIDSPTDKVVKALSFGIKIITKNDLILMLK